jgi:hypothetical protein
LAAHDPAPLTGPIFLIGAKGSGTTLLRLILDSHEHIAVPRETGFMRAYDAHRFIPFWWSGRTWAERLGWSSQELDAELRAFYDRIFMRYAERSGKRRWGEKTPLHTWHVDDMARLFPDAVFVGIVRHPGGSVASNLGRWQRIPLGQAVSHYRRQTRELIRQAARHGNRFVILRYEELVAQPEPVLRELLDWLGEPWSPGTLEHHAIQRERGGHPEVEGRNRADEPIDAARAARWAHTLDGATRRHLARRLGRLGAFFGYSFEDPGTLAPLADGFLLGGDAVDVRIDDFAELDLRKAGPVPLADRLLHPRRVQPRPARATVVQGGAAHALGRLAWERVPERARRRVRPWLDRLGGRP